jgi:tagaturonate epimerase
MSVEPDELGPSATALLGDGAYPESQVSYAGATYWLERSIDGVKRLVVVADDESAFRGFAGTAERIDGKVRFVAETTPENALALRSVLPWLTPSRFGLRTSTGFGDRIGLATPGHVRALKAVNAAINPVFAQQSIREMGRCHRTPRNVLDDATGVPSRLAGRSQSAATQIILSSSRTSTTRWLPASSSTPWIPKQKSTLRRSTPILR